ncbi:MAG: hypothetical protein DRP51_08690 [Candidatus Zixiibacteriota bacterium]|nr:MAG: hypothetical protein DRP51_08690 [candidate division Zixibacteria bacterium]
MNKYLLFLTLILPALLFSFACVNSGSPTNESNDIASVNWVGSEAIFNSIEGKKDYSIIFFYADWCGYCHLMDQNTFSNATVVNILNQSFNSVRVNAESDSLLVHFDSTVTGQEMKTIYDVRGYPTICFFKGDGEYLTHGIGYIGPDDFTTVLNRVLSGEFD